MILKLEKVIDIDNDVLYQHTKSQSEITCILGLKSDKSDRFWRFEILHFTNLNVRFCHFSVA
jgi:hypothetical protein